MFKNTPAFSGYSVDSIEKAKEFYETMLGLDVSQTKEGLSIKLYGGGTVFIYPKADHLPATFTVLNFVVENIDDSVAELEKKGIRLENYDNGMMKADEKGIYRGLKAGDGPDIAWFKDLAGNILSVLQNK